MPARIFTPEMVALIKKGKPYNDLFRHTTSADAAQGAAKWYKRIPISRWEELISPFAPISITGGVWNRRGKCPFCAKPFEGCVMSREELVSTPFRAGTRCCGRTVYARVEEMPAEYPAKPNHTERIPHLDGTVHDYAFHVPPGCEDDRSNWSCSSGEVWRARQRVIIDLLFPYTSAVFCNDDRQAALQLAAILDRLADVYPGYPLYDNQMPHGLARGRDGKSYLTREEYLSTPRPQPFEKPFWFRWENWHFDKIPGSSRFGGWHNGAVALAGILASGFDMIRDRPEVKDWSAAKHGSPDAFEKRVMERVFREYQDLFKAVPAKRNNTVWTWIRGATRLGILLQDEYFLREAVAHFESNIINNYFSDGLSTEGSFAYAAQVRTLIDHLWVVKHFTGIDLDVKYPFLKQIRTLGAYPIETLYRVESMHGDTHALFFATQRIQKGVQPPEPGAVDYAGHEASLCFPETGLACLRAGAPGSRLETILDFQSASNSHTHNGRLNLQLFYEGVNLLPDVGYASRVADLSRSPWKDYEYHFKKLPLPANSKIFRESYVKQPHSHCTALVDGLNHKRGPATFHRFLGGQGMGEPGYAVQFVEADARAVFCTEVTFADQRNVSWDPSRPRKVTRFRRQVATLTLPSGRSVVLDVFRIKGGQRHEIYWHVPAESARVSLGTPETLKQQTVQEYLRSATGDAPSDGKYGPNDSALAHLNAPRRWEMPNRAWQAEWLVQPSRFEPVTPKGRKRYAPWARLLHDVQLRMWGAVRGSRAEDAEILRARGPWPSGMAEEHRRGKVFAFEDALDFLIESRRAQEAPLQSTFVHVLEPYDPEQGPTLSEVEVLEGETTDAADGCAVWLRVREGSGEDRASDVLVATTVDGGAFRRSDIQLRGRLGMACPDELAIVLYDGTELQTEGLGVTLEPGWYAKLEAVVGDLTGHVGESALVVTSAHPLPTDETLVGQMLTVHHQISDIHTTGYTIDRVRSLGQQRYRIDLRDQPPFIQYQSRLRKLDTKEPCYVYGSSPNTKGPCSGLFQGRQIRFQRTGVTRAIKAILWARTSGTDLIEMETPREKGDVAVGDPFVIYTIQPGDEVVIPSLFAARARKPGENRVDLRVFTTGTADLRIPDRYRLMSMTSGGKRAAFEQKTIRGQMSVTIDHGSISDGRALLSLSVK